jgi:hypothetical protein
MLKFKKESALANNCRSSAQYNLVRIASAFALLLALAVAITLAAVTPTYAATDMSVYTDSLANGWANGSWGVAVSLSNTSPVHSGTASIATTVNSTQWGGLYLMSNAALNSSGYSGARFWIHGGSAGGQHISFKIIDGSNGNWDSSVSITPTANTWTLVTVSLAQVNNPTTIGGLVWQDDTGSSQPTFYVDDVVLVGYNGPTLTPPPTSPPGQGPALSVTVGSDVHPISPYIYGMNWADADLATDLHLPIVGVVTQRRATTGTMTSAIREMIGTTRMFPSTTRMTLSPKMLKPVLPA